MRRSLFLPLAIGLFLLAHGATRDAAQIQKEYRQVKASKPGNLGHRWELAEEWALAYLNSHPQATDDSLSLWMATLDPAPALEEQGGIEPKRRSECDSNGEFQIFDSSVQRLGGRSFLLTASYQNVDCDSGASDDQTGTFFVVSQTAGAYKVAWRVRESRDNRLAEWTKPHPRIWALNPYPLPATRSGHARFYVDGNHTHIAGFTMGGQLSIWEWDGAVAQLLFVRDYAFVWAEDDPVQLDGNLLRLHSKEHFKIFQVYGISQDSEAEQVIRISANAIQDLGIRGLHPELDLIDELYFRVHHGLSATDIASPEVVERLAKSTAPTQGDSCTSLNGWNQKGSMLCVSIMNDMENRIFTLSRSGGKLFITGLQHTSPEFGEACNNPGN